MLVPILPMQPEYESTHVRALFNKESLLITQEKGNSTIFSQVIENSVLEGDGLVRMHIMKSVDKYKRPHYLLVRGNILTRPPFEHLESAFIMVLEKEVNARFVSEVSELDYEVDDSIMQEFGKPEQTIRGLD